MAKFVPGPPPLGNVVMRMKLGNTRIAFCDDAYRNRSYEEQMASLERIGHMGAQAMLDKIVKEEEEKRNNSQGAI